MPHATESQSLGMFQTVPHPMPQQGQDSGEAAITLPETRASIPVRASGISAAQMAKIFPTDLNVAEKMWRDRYRFFKDQHGLSLRPRYHPDWRPSWIAEEHDPSYCEDAIAQILPMILDVTDKDGHRLCLKYIAKRTQEVTIAQFLTSELLRDDPRNHSVLIYDSFTDPFDPSVDYLVMQVLRPFNDPEFGAVGEVVEFTTQILEGLAFMHMHGVAHGDFTGPNIMMDGRPLYPQGWHFVADSFSPDGRDLLTPLARIDHPVRYYIVDFGCSVRLLPGQRHIVTGEGGRDQDPPELDDYKPYDPFKLDVFTAGNMLLKDFHQKYEGLDFLVPLIDTMTTRDPQLRPTAHSALERWYKMKASLNVSMARWRLQKPEETVGERVVLNAVAMVHQGIHSLKYLFRDQPRTWANP